MTNAQENKISQGKQTGRGRGSILDRVIREWLPDKETLEQKPEGSEGPDHLIFQNKYAFQADETANAGAQRQGNVWHILRMAQKQVWVEYSKKIGRRSRQEGRQHQIR